MGLRLRTALLAFFAGLCTIFSLANGASAQGRTAGAVALVGILGGDEKGAAGIADLYTELGVLRLGLGLGVGVVSNPNGERSRAFTPFGVSTTLVLGAEQAAGLELRGRFGFWGGATDHGLRSGAWGSIGGWVRISLGSRAAFLLGCDLWFQTNTERAMYIVPGLGFSWSSS
ncbi:MAG: hypothetical protein IPK60_08885 [Sandaracinaceae bacterium]|nr:hypothetical protein [Sandaracinaceae bacterium]